MYIYVNGVAFLVHFRGTLERFFSYSDDFSMDIGYLLPKPELGIFKENYLGNKYSR